MSPGARGRSASQRCAVEVWALRHLAERRGGRWWGRSAAVGVGGSGGLCVGAVGAGEGRRPQLEGRIGGWLWDCSGTSGG